MVSFEKTLTAVVAGLLVITLAALFIVTREQRGDFKLAFLDVGQGDGTLISFDSKTQMLVDCGPSRTVLQGLGRRMSFFDRTIEYLVVTHPDLDHYLGCIDVLERYRVERVWWTGRNNANDPQWQVFKEAVARESAEVRVIDRVEQHDIGETVIDVLYPDHPVADEKADDNNTSVVMRVQYGALSTLLTGDAEEELERHLVQEYGARLRVKILKAGHHGSNSSSIQEFLDTVAPEIAVISAGKNNKYGHPTERVLRRLERLGATIRRTDLEGDVVYYP
ncbi:MAG: MBL fold metallo-hydrolase [Candidatus Magasanikbacteria bacterium]|nr:MBL fold metallo-hydrolase [Candidatus Magasanikbacteria bacterium]